MLLETDSSKRFCSLVIKVRRSVWIISLMRSASYTLRWMQLIGQKLEGHSTNSPFLLFVYANYVVRLTEMKNRETPERGTSSSRVF